MTVAHVVRDVAYLPLPNEVEIVLHDIESPSHLTASAFMIPVFPDGSLLMATNQRRGIEIPGGHVEPGETLMEAAIREALEETGCTVTNVAPIGYLRMTTRGAKPEGYRYPYPLSYQQFFAGRVSTVSRYEVNDECGEPKPINDLSRMRPSIRIFGERARTLLSSTM